MLQGKGLGTMEDLDLVQVAAWNRYGWLRHGFSTRSGGVSMVYCPRGAEGELNLGWTKEDTQETVKENRWRVVQAVGKGTDLKLVTVRQVHGVEVLGVRDGDDVFAGRLETPTGRAVLEGDGLMTGVAGVLLGIQTADCVPVLVVDVERRVVAAFHAGWRGTVAGIAEQGVAAMGREYGSRVDDLVAAVGPSIGACCYEVGEEVRGEFGRAFRYGADLFAGNRLDLWEANRRQLLAAGVGEEKISVVGECTACARNEDGRRRYFSHRDETGLTGRMLSLVGVV
jgi:YfiH family protein